jgi:hypothetical protein
MHTEQHGLSPAVTGQALGSAPWQLHTGKDDDSKPKSRVRTPGGAWLRRPDDEAARPGLLERPPRERPDAVGSGRSSSYFIGTCPAVARLLRPALLVAPPAGMSPAVNARGCLAGRVSPLWRCATKSRLSRDTCSSQSGAWESCIHCHEDAHT